MPASLYACYGRDYQILVRGNGFCGNVLSGGLFARRKQFCYIVARSKFLTVEFALLGRCRQTNMLAACVNAQSDWLFVSRTSVQELDCKRVCVLQRMLFAVLTADEPFQVSHWHQGLAVPVEYIHILHDAMLLSIKLQLKRSCSLLRRG